MLGLRLPPMRVFQKSFKRRRKRCQFSSTIFRMFALRWLRPTLRGLPGFVGALAYEPAPGQVRLQQVR
jgi:hypothetical protein